MRKYFGNKRVVSCGYKHGKKIPVLFTVSHTRRIRSTFTYIQDEHGVILHGHKNIAMAATKYLDNLYTSQDDISTHFPRVFQGFNQCVSMETNEDLVRDISEEEIKNTIFQIGPNKASGPDGFYAVFYHQHWDVGKDDIIKNHESY